MATVRRRGDSFEIRVSAGYDLNGKQLRRNFTWNPEPGLTQRQIQKELDRQSVLFEEKVRTGQFIDGNIKFKEFSDKWLVLHAEQQLAPKTVLEYRNQLKRVNQAIGHIRLDRLQPSRLAEFYENLAEEDVRSDTHFKPSEKFFDAVRKSNLNSIQLAKKSGLGSSTCQMAIGGKVISKKSAEALTRSLEANFSDLFSPVHRASRLSNNSILHYHRIISSILSTAVEWQIILSNPAERVRPPKIVKKEPKYLDEDGAKNIIEHLQDEPIQFKTMVTLLIYTGLRRGELCGLKWSDFDYDKKLLHIRRAVQYLPRQGLFEKETKSGSSIRVIKLSAIAVTLLQEYRAAQRMIRDARDEDWQDNDLIFTRPDGTYFNPDDLTRRFNAFLKRNKLPMINIHSLRHTNATLMIASGTDVRTVSRRLGHAQTSTTMNIYSHAIKSADEAAAETIDDIFQPISNSKLRMRATEN